MTGVIVTLVVPSGHTVDRGVLLHEMEGLTEVAEEIFRHVKIFFNDDGVLCTLEGG